MVNDLRLELRTRNNVLWHLIFDEHESVAAFCRKHDLLDKSRVGALLNLTMSPYTLPSEGFPSGEPTRIAVRLARIARLPVEDLFPRSLYDKLHPLHLIAEIPSASFRPLSAAKNVALLPAQEGVVEQRERHDILGAVLGTLTEREEKVVRARFGLDGGGERELKEVAADIGVSAERIRQIEAKALRKLRHPSRSRHLSAFLIR